MQGALLVALGGALGSAARYGVNIGFARLVGTAFPWATLTVNVFGSLLMGLLAGVLLRHHPEAEDTRLFLATGVLGGFTTFSAFSLELVTLLQKGQAGAAVSYAVFSVVLSALAAFAGFLIVRSLA